MSKGRRVIIACLLLWLSFPISLGLAEEAAPFRLCADPDNLPFSSQASPTPGFYAELGSEIARVMGRPFEPVWVPTYYTKRQVRKKLLPGQCDGFAGVPDDASFMGPRLIFSKPIIRLGYAIVALPSLGITSVKDLHGRRVAVQWNSPPQSLLSAWTDTQIVTVMTPEEGMQDLNDNKADAAFIWGASAGWQNISALHSIYSVVPIEGEHLQWSAAIAFPRDRTELRDSVDRALDSLAPSIDALAHRYGFPDPLSPPATPASLESPDVASADVVAGRKIFNTTCAHCHGHDAVQGEQRRNLRMLRQRYGENMSQTFLYTVNHGRISKGMPNWNGIFSDEEFQKILAFLTSIQDPGG